MFRFSASAVLLALIVGCSEASPDTPLVSQAVAAPGHKTPDYGWKTSISPTADEGPVADYE